jgi:hypothetical protein
MPDYTSIHTGPVIDAGVSKGNTSVQPGDLSTVAITGSYADLTSIPSTFAPSAHTQTASTITDFGEAVDDRIFALLVEGANISLTYDDVINTLTIGAIVAPTNLTYTANSRLLESSTGTDVTLPLVSSLEAGLAPASGGGTTNFLRADGSWAAPPGGGGGVSDGDKGDVVVSGGGTVWELEPPAFSSYLYMKPATGVFIANAKTGVANTTQVGAVDAERISPWLCPYNINIDQLGVSVSTLLAGSNLKVTIYNSDDNGRPSTLVAESANISGAATGTFFATVSVSLQKGKLYWIGVRYSGTVTIRAVAQAGSTLLSVTNAATPALQPTLIRTLAFATPATTWVYASSQHNTAFTPLVLMRVA